MMNVSTTMHRAAWLVPVSSPPIADGAVCCESGVITAVGSFSALQGRGGRVVDHGSAILCPALINAHSHLELSHLAALGQGNDYFPAGAITAWIKELLAAREAGAATADPRPAALAAAKAMRAGGIIATADIGNDPNSRQLGAGSDLHHLFFLEFLGLAAEAARLANLRLGEQAADIFCTAHAPYSCHPELIQAVKARATAHGQLFPIHVAESEAEVEFLQSGSGAFRDFLLSRVGNPGSTEKNGWLSSYNPPGCGPVEYLARLGVLDQRTLLVHAIHLSDQEIELVAQHQARVCLCPGSNRFLGVGKAKVSRMLAAGLRPALGTDSLASNPALDLWQEMRILRKDHPHLAPETVLAMATANGAEALGLGSSLGRLAPGKRANFLSVTPAGEVGADPYEYLTTSVTPSQIGWVEEK